MSARGWAIFGAIGLVLGMAAGLLYGWVISPVQYVDTAPASLRADHKAEYIRAAALAYAETGDLERARTRLAALDDPGVAQAVAALAQQSAAEGQGIDEVRAIANLAAALGAGPAPIAEAPSATPEPASPIPRPTLTPTRRPTLSPTTRPSPTPQATAAATLEPRVSATSVAPFRFISKEKVCRPSLGQPLIQVEVMDSSGQPVPGMGVVVEWDGGSNRFFTGFKPELGMGYADFTMTEGVTYTLRIDRGSETLRNISAEPCASTGGGTFPGSWLFKFRQGQ